MADLTYLEYRDDKSEKFYEVIVAGTQVTLRYGRIGSPGQQSTTTYPNPEKAQGEATKKINEKLRKGYRPTTPGDPPPPPPAPVVRPPSRELLNQAFHNASGPPAVARPHLRQLTYPLGFTQRDLEFAHLNIPLGRSLVCFELVATYADGDDPTFASRAAGQFTLAFLAQGALVYGVKFLPKERRLYHGDNINLPSPETGAFVPFPPELTAGQLFQLVLVMASPREVILYLNNQPFTHCFPAPLAAPLDSLRIHYRVAGLHLHMMRVLEPRGADRAAAVAPPSPQPLAPPLPADPWPLPAPGPRVDPASLPLPSWLQGLPPEFDGLGVALEADLVPYIAIAQRDVRGEAPLPGGGRGWCADPLPLWHSKAGGFPYLPQGMAYPADRRTGRMMMFLLQVNCAELPRVAGLGLPERGLLQFFVGLDVAMCDLSPERHRVRYFPDITTDPQRLVTDFSFLGDTAGALEWYDGVYALEFTAARDVFWEARHCLDESFQPAPGVQEQFEALEEWLMDLEEGPEEVEPTGHRASKLGGYPEMVSTVPDVLYRAQGQLLLALNSADSCDDSFFFYIQPSDLARGYFDGVESYFVRD